MKDYEALSKKHFYGQAAEYDRRDTYYYSQNGKISCKDIAEQIRERIANNEIPFYMHTLRITITIGVAPHKNGRQIEETISDADSRLYIGKGNGKNRVVS